MNAAPPSSEPTRKTTFSSAEARVENLERRRELGQFFTPIEVARFMWEALEILHGRRFPTSTRVIDPACGEGVFLTVAAERGMLAEGLFGADIDESLVPI